jgi:hypothetical protein
MNFVRNAVGYNYPCTYTDHEEDVIQYAFRNGQIVKKAAIHDALAKTFMMWNL